MSREVGIVSAIGAFLALILECVSVGTTDWVHFLTVSQGLWQICHPVTGCRAWKNHEVTNQMKAVQALTIISCIMLVAVISLSIVLTLKKGSEKVLKAEAWLHMLVMFSLTSAMILYTTEIEYMDRSFSHSYGYSYFLGWVASGLLLITLFVGAIISRLRR